jgi:hypothetical protein
MATPSRASGPTGHYAIPVWFSIAKTVSCWRIQPESEP